MANSTWGETPPQTIPQQPQPQVMHQAPQPMMIGSVNHQSGQVTSPFNTPVQYQQSYDKIYANDWLIMGIVSLAVGFFMPSICTLISLVGVISMATKLNIEKTQPGHPEADKVKPALIVNVLAVIIPIIVLVVMFSIGVWAS